MIGHDLPSPVDLAMQETAAAYAEELRAHVALARVHRSGGGAAPSPGLQRAYYDAKGRHEDALLRLRRVLGEEEPHPQPSSPGVPDEP